MKEQELDMTELLDFEVSDVVEVEPEVEGELVPIDNETDLEKDYLKSRETYHKLIENRRIWIFLKYGIIISNIIQKPTVILY